MSKARFFTLAAVIAGAIGLAAPQASALPVMIMPTVAPAAASSPSVIDVGYHGGGGHYNGYHGNYYRRPNYNYYHRPNYWNPSYGRRCNGWTNYCRYHYNGYYYSNQWWLAPAIGVGVGVAIAGSNSNRHVAWCESRYRSYNPRNNTWIAYGGQVRQCVSPYGG